MSVDEVRLAIRRLSDRLRAMELAAAGRVREAREVMANQAEGRLVAAVEVNRTVAYMADGKRVR